MGVIRTISDKIGVASTCSTSMVYYQHLIQAHDRVVTIAVVTIVTRRQQVLC